MNAENPENAVSRRHGWILVPATETDHFPVAEVHAPAVTVVDLEDSVARHLKQTARDHVQKFVVRIATEALVPGVRINALATLDGIQDILTLARDTVIRPEVLLLPKVESARDVELLASCLDSTSYRPQIYALIETVRAIENLFSIVRSERLSGIFFGAGDYARSAGCAGSWDALLHARSRVVAGAAHAGIPALDAPFFDSKDLNGLQHEAELSQALGFAGKIALHPRQLPIISAVFCSSP